jgi:hypothetical protein
MLNESENVACQNFLNKEKLILRYPKVEERLGIKRKLHLRFDRVIM